MSKPTPSNRNELAPAPATRALDVGQKVIAGGIKGQQIARAKLAPVEAARNATILALANADLAAGRPMRGMARRLAGKIGTLTERHIRRILSDGLSQMSD